MKDSLDSRRSRRDSQQSSANISYIQPSVDQQVGYRSVRSIPSHQCVFGIQPKRTQSRLLSMRLLDCQRPSEVCEMFASKLRWLGHPPTPGHLYFVEYHNDRLPPSNSQDDSDADFSPDCYPIRSLQMNCCNKVDAPKPEYCSTMHRCETDSYNSREYSNCELKTPVDEDDCDSLLEAMLQSQEDDLAASLQEDSTESMNDELMLLSDSKAGDQIESRCCDSFDSDAVRQRCIPMHASVTSCPASLSSVTNNLGTNLKSCARCISNSQLCSRSRSIDSHSSGFSSISSATYRLRSGSNELNAGKTGAHKCYCHGLECRRSAESRKIEKGSEPHSNSSGSTERRLEMLEVKVNKLVAQVSQLCSK